MQLVVMVHQNGLRKVVYSCGLADQKEAKTVLIHWPIAGYYVASLQSGKIVSYGEGYPIERRAEVERWQIDPGHLRELQHSLLGRRVPMKKAPGC
jgi:hypothetical protein